MVFENEVNFITSNWYWFILALFMIYFVYDWFFRSSKEKKLKPLSRSEIERKNFVERNKHNTTSLFNWVFRGDKLLGRLESIRIMTLIENGGEKEAKPKDMIEDKDLAMAKGFVEMVIKPTLFSRLKFVNPFAKEICLMISKEKVEFDFGSREVYIDERVITDEYFGIYYDLSMKKEFTKHIINDQVFKTDLENLASIYFVKSQEQSTYQPDYAHELALREKELQIELAKKRGKTTSI